MPNLLFVTSTGFIVNYIQGYFFLVYLMVCLAGGFVRRLFNDYGHLFVDKIQEIGVSGLFGC